MQLNSIYWNLLNWRTTQYNLLSHFIIWQLHENCVGWKCNNWEYYIYHKVNTLNNLPIFHGTYLYIACPLSPAFWEVIQSTKRLECSQCSSLKDYPGCQGAWFSSSFLIYIWTSRSQSRSSFPQDGNLMVCCYDFSH